MNVNKKEEIEIICDGIMSNLSKYLNNEVYVEKDDKYYLIKSYTDTINTKILTIKINKEFFSFSLIDTARAGYVMFNYSPKNITKENQHNTGDFEVNISEYFFKKYEEWLIYKTDEYLIIKMKHLENSLYKTFSIDKKVKRKKVVKFINEI